MRILIITLCVLFSHAIAAATPFLVCDAYPEEDGIYKFVGILDGKAFEIAYSLHPRGGAIIYDLASLDDGKHNFSEIRAVNIRGQSSPIPFVLPRIPSSPGHLGILP